MRSEMVRSLLRNGEAAAGPKPPNELAGPNESSPWLPPNRSTPSCAASPSSLPSSLPSLPLSFNFLQSEPQSLLLENSVYSLFFPPPPPSKSCRKLPNCPHPPERAKNVRHLSPLHLTLQRRFTHFRESKPSAYPNPTNLIIIHLTALI